jgi:hypothetical protein
MAAGGLGTLGIVGAAAAASAVSLHSDRTHIAIHIAGRWIAALGVVALG